MQYSFDFYHYQHENVANPFCIRIVKHCDTEKRPFMSLAAYVYCETVDNASHAFSVRSGDKFSIDGFAMDIWREGVRNNVAISNDEYARLIDFITDVILDNRKPY